MRTQEHAPANDPHAPAAGTRNRGNDRDPEARLDALMNDGRVARIIRAEGPPRELLLRVRRAVRRELARGGR